MVHCVYRQSQADSSWLAVTSYNQTVDEKRAVPVKLFHARAYALFRATRPEVVKISK